MNKYEIKQSPLALAVGVALAGGSAQAATITVTTAADGPLGAITDECTLRAAVAAANGGVAVDGCPSGSDGADEIVFESGLAQSTITLVDGEIGITNDLAITGPVPESWGGITLDAAGESRVLSASGADIELRGLTLTGGHVVTGTSGHAAGLVVYGGNLTMHHCRVSGNSVSGRSYTGAGLGLSGGSHAIYDSRVSENTSVGVAYGGGIGVDGGELVIHGSEITDNVATHAENNSGRGRGGGLYIRDGKLSIYGSTISGNQSKGGRGGGIFAGASDVLLVDSEISGNSAQYRAGKCGICNGAGGGLFAYDSERSGHVVPAKIRVDLTRTSVLDNSTAGPNGYGGGLAIVAEEAQAEVTITNSIVSANSTAGDNSPGGGIVGYGSPGSPVNVTLRNTTVSNNSTQGTESSGGGVWIDHSDLHVENSTISNNSTAGESSYGGGLAVKYGETYLVNSTVTGNSAAGPLGGGLNAFGNAADGGGDATLVHSTMAYNTAGTTGHAVAATYDLQLRNSLLIQVEEDQQACNAPASVSTNTFVTDDSCTGVAVDLEDIAPQPLADNGGPTPTHALASNSAAIDAAGDCAGDFDVDRDQRGLRRPGPGSSACDIGAFEAGVVDIFDDRFEAP